ncbi:hypothetical protein sos41_11690 [Alphaproteobacteria bacterium SO-S41]|nr:hypothetical protein sos41_11690 [Alphaproteobacteria bacterium SO-S41]
MSRIYVASSWRNEQQPAVVAALRESGHEVYDFKNPAPDNDGFRWSDCSAHGDAKSGPRDFARVVTQSPIARRGFGYDKAALDWCDVCVCVLPCGRSAHLEAGYACGQGKRVIFLLSDKGFEPELMYLLGDGLALTVDDVVAELARPYSRCRVLDTEDDTVSRCEACTGAIGDDEPFHMAGESMLCRECAPTYAELAKDLIGATKHDHGDEAAELRERGARVQAEIDAGKLDPDAKAVG